MTQRVNKQIGVLATIEPECHFVQVGRKMLRADLVPASHDAAFEKRESGFHRVSVDVSVNVNLITMANGLVSQTMNPRADHRLWIRGKFVSDHHVHIGTNILLDVLCQCSRLNIARMKETEIAATLPNANHNFFIVVWGVPSLAAALLSADISFVHLDSTIKHGPFYLAHGSTNPMAEIPRGFVGAAIETPNGTFELVSTHSLLGFAKQQDSHEPYRQRQMGVVEDRARSYRKLITALAARELLAGINPPYIAIAAPWALSAFGPPKPGKNLSAILIGGK